MVTITVQDPKLQQKFVIDTTEFSGMNDTILIVADILLSIVTRIEEEKRGENNAQKSN